MEGGVARSPHMVRPLGRSEAYEPHRCPDNKAKREEKGSIGSDAYLHTGRGGGREDKSGTETGEGRGEGKTREEWGGRNDPEAKGAPGREGRREPGGRGMATAGGAGGSCGFCCCLCCSGRGEGRRRALLSTRPRRKSALLAANRQVALHGKPFMNMA